MADLAEIAASAVRPLSTTAVNVVPDAFALFVDAEDESLDGPRAPTTCCITCIRSRKVN